MWFCNRYNHKKITTIDLLTWNLKFCLVFLFCYLKDFAFLYLWTAGCRIRIVECLSSLSCWCCVRPNERATFTVRQFPRKENKIPPILKLATCLCNVNFIGRKHHLLCAIWKTYINGRLLHRLFIPKAIVYWPSNVPRASAFTSKSGWVNTILQINTEHQFALFLKPH